MKSMFWKTSRLGVIVVFTVSLWLLGGQAMAQPYSVELTNDIPYGPNPNDFRNWLDIYQPAELEGTPVIVFVHGGAWARGDKADYVELGTTFSAYYGFTTVVINYRLSPDVQLPEHVVDAALAVAWVKDNIAGYGGDPNAIFLFGHSAGGHMVSLLATDGIYLEDAGYSKQVLSGVISMSGVYNLNALVPVAIDLMFDTFGSLSPAELAEYSPASHIGDWQPPFLIQYAEEDIPTLARQAKNFHKKLRRDRSPSEIDMLEGHNHLTEIVAISTNTPESGITMQIVDFVNAHLP